MTQPRMRANLGGLLAAVFLVSPVFSWPAPADAGPPFDAPATWEDCEALFATCAQTASADGSTGEVSVEAAVSSTGEVPIGSAWSHASAGFSVEFTLAEPAQAVDITFEVLVHEAGIASQAGDHGIFGEPYGSVDFIVVALHRGCSCEEVDLVSVAGSWGPDHRRDWAFFSTMTLADADGGEIPAGRLHIFGAIEARATTGSTVAYSIPGSGSATAQASATVRALTVDPL